MAQPEEILEFWFGKPGSEEYGKPRKEWFGPAPEFDEEVRRRFLPDYERAIAGDLASWEETPEGSLALTLLLDQCSSILFRGTARAFEADVLGRRVAKESIERGFDQRFPDVCRWFYYLPLEHSEDPADQQRSVDLFSALEPTEANLATVDYAVRHQRVIQRFGRFPNRNAALGRESTPEELEFLAGPDAPF
ncbi:MAG TPA: DUF924 family protein [Armatimonadota bacterium]|jgi:uncharacterized protein (DUF924 family)